MKGLLLLTTLFTISLYANAQGRSSEEDKINFYFGIGANVGIQGQSGNQLSFSLAKKEHVFRIQFLENKLKNKTSGPKDTDLNVTTGIRAYSLTYSYSFSDKMEVFYRL